MSCGAPLGSPSATRASEPEARSAGHSSTCVQRRRKLSTFVDEWPRFVENLVDGIVDRAYCPTSAPQLRTVIWVTALARGWGDPAGRLDQRGKTEGRRVREESTPGAARP